MNQNFERTQLAEGVFLSVISDAKFTHNRLSINLVVPMATATVSGNAIVPYLLRKGSRLCNDFTLLNRRLDDLYGAGFVSDVSKSGANQVITLGIKTLDDAYTLEGESLLGEAAELLRELLFDPMIAEDAFPEKDFSLEQTYLIDTIEAEINDKRSLAVSRCRSIMGGGDPASLRKYGTTEQAKALTAAIAASHYRRLLETASVEIFLTGPGSPAAAAVVLKRAFAGRGRQPVPFTPTTVVPVAEQVREVVDRMEVAQSKLVFGFRSGVRGTPREQTALRVMTAIYGGTPSSKLFLHVREKLSLCYYCAARFDKVSGIMMVDCGVEEQNIESARREILGQFEELRQGKFDDETFDNTLLMLQNSLRAVRDNAGVIEDWYLGHILDGNLSTPEEEMVLLSSITREDVLAAAEKISLDTIYLLTKKEEA